MLLRQVENEVDRPKIKFPCAVKTEETKDGIFKCGGTLVGQDDVAASALCLLQGINEIYPVDIEEPIALYVNTRAFQVAAGWFCIYFKQLSHSYLNFSHFFRIIL